MYQTWYYMFFALASHFTFSATLWCEYHCLTLQVNKPQPRDVNEILSKLPYPRCTCVFRIRSLKVKSTSGFVLQLYSDKWQRRLKLLVHIKVHKRMCTSIYTSINIMHIYLSQSFFLQFELYLENKRNKTIVCLTCATESKAWEVLDYAGLRNLCTLLALSHYIFTTIIWRIKSISTSWTRPWEVKQYPWGLTGEMWVQPWAQSLQS